MVKITSKISNKQIYKKAMKEESDIPLLKSYNKDTTVIETDPFMEKRQMNSYELMPNLKRL